MTEPSTKKDKYFIEPFELTPELIGVDLRFQYKKTPTIIPLPPTTPLKEEIISYYEKQLESRFGKYWSDLFTREIKEALPAETKTTFPDVSGYGKEMKRWHEMINGIVAVIQAHKRKIDEALEPRLHTADDKRAASLDPLAFAVKNGIKIKYTEKVVAEEEGKVKYIDIDIVEDPILFAYNHGMLIGGKDPLEWAISSNVPIIGYDPLKFLCILNKVKDEYATIGDMLLVWEGAWAQKKKEKGEKVDGLDADVWFKAWNSAKKGEGFGALLEACGFKEPKEGEKVDNIQALKVWSKVVLSINKMLADYEMQYIGTGEHTEINLPGQVFAIARLDSLLAEQEEESAKPNYQLNKATNERFLDILEEVDLITNGTILWVNTWVTAHHKLQEKGVKDVSVVKGVSVKEYEEDLKEEVRLLKILGENISITLLELPQLEELINKLKKETLTPYELQHLEKLTEDLERRTQKKGILTPEELLQLKKLKSRFKKEEEPPKSPPPPKKT